MCILSAILASKKFYACLCLFFGVVLLVCNVPNDCLPFPGFI